MVVIDNVILTPDEIEACATLVHEIREKKELIQKERKYKHEISSQIADMISDIGLAETKHIVREVLREIRELEG